MIVGFLYNVHAIRLVLAPVCYIFCLPYRRSWCDTITHWLDMVHCSPAPWCRFCQQASISATEALISPIATFQSSSMTVDYIATLWFAPQGFVPLIFYNGYLFDSHTSIDIARPSIWDIRYQPHKFLFHYTISTWAWIHSFCQILLCTPISFNSYHISKLSISIYLVTMKQKYILIT